MKKILSIAIVIAFLFSSCRTKEDRAKALIDDQLKNSLNDYKSYEAVKFSTLDSAFTTVDDDSTYSDASDSFQEAKKVCEDNIEDEKIYVGIDDDKAAEYADIVKGALQTMKKFGFILDSISEKFKPVFIGWEMEHTYRAKTAAGNLEIFFYNYYFDSTIDKLIKHTDVTDDKYHKTVIDSTR